MSDIAHTEAHNEAHDGAHDEHGGEVHFHVSPWQTLVAVFVALVCLTGLTVYVATYDVGRFDLLAAMAIATVKCFLVMGFFMHLKYDRAMNRLVFFGSILFFCLFLGITVIDLDASKPAMDEYRTEVPFIKHTEPKTTAPKTGEVVKPGEKTDHGKK